MDFLINKTITGIYAEFESKKLTLFFTDNTKLILQDCLYFSDLGIINNKINFVSEEGTMSFVIICRQLAKDYEDFSYLLLSNDIKNYEEKKEISIVYKSFIIE